MDTLKKIAELVRNHYFEQFMADYMEQKRKVRRNRTVAYGGTANWRLMPDCDLKNLTRNIDCFELQKINPTADGRLFRHDMVIFRDHKPIEQYICWPVIIHEFEESAEDDIPNFNTEHFSVRITEVEVNPFPWFNCNLTIYPNAEPVKGIIDMWFYKWFFHQSKPDPLRKVIHSIIGPLTEEESGESYLIDFGSAPAHAFIELIDNVCRTGINRIIIK